MTTSSKSAAKDDPPELSRNSLTMDEYKRKKLNQQLARFDSLGRKFSRSSQKWMNESFERASLNSLGLAAGVPTPSGGGADEKSGQHNTSSINKLPLVKPHWKRYIILLLFSLNSGNKAFQWIQISASTTKATQFYQVDNYVINATSLVFLISFIILSWPACLLIEQIGLRKAVLLASFGTAVGSVIKCFSCNGVEESIEGIVLLMLGQIFVSLSEQMIFSLPSRLASVWFPDREVSSAVALCILGNQLGVAIGFLAPQYFLSDATTSEQIGLGFYRMFLVTAAFSVFAFIIDYLMFDEEPVLAPGLARYHQRELERAERAQGNLNSLWVQIRLLFRQIGSILKNRDLVLLALSYGITCGTTYTIPTLLDQMLEQIWPNDDLIKGNTGFIFVVFGCFGMLIWGKLMDTWRAYKWINMWLVLVSIGSLILFAYLLIALRSVWGVYLSSLLLGTFLTGIMATGLEFAVELTYPAPELVTASVMNVTPQIFGTIITLIGSFIVDTFGPLATNVFYLGCLLVGLLLLAITREQLKRQEAIMEQEQKGLNRTSIQGA